MHNGLEFLERVQNDINRPRWKIKCSCDNIFYVTGSSHITKGLTVSCGCKNKKRGRVIYGDYLTRLYRIWQGMKARCLDTNSKAYKTYGGVGITVCEEWKDYVNFKKWALSNGYSEELSIDRIESTGNYEPSNCRWATLSLQSQNTKVNSKNTSGVKGISLTKYNTWEVYIGIDKKRVNLGTYKKDQFIKAIRARQKGEQDYWVAETQDFKQLIAQAKAEGYTDEG